MQKWKRIFLRILCPGKVLTFIIPVLGFSLLGYVFFQGWEETPLGYASYVLAFYSLVLLILGSIPLVQNIKTAYQNVQRERPYHLRKSLFRSLTINVCYSVFQIAMGLYYHSVWFFSCGIYYVVLSLIRLALVRYEAKQSECELDQQKQIIGWNGFRTCGILMLLLNVTMTGMVFQMIWRGQGSHYHEIMVYAVATYTFYRLTMSIIRVIQKRGRNDPLEGAARNINLTAAIMSLYSLQVTMLNVFGEDMQYVLLMNRLSGGAVCFLVILGALGMTIHGTVRKKELAR